jgi:hypothetical protein
MLEGNIMILLFLTQLLFYQERIVAQMIFHE